MRKFVYRDFTTMILTPVEHTISQQGIDFRLGRLMQRQWSGKEKEHALEQVLNMIDLTTLEGSDTDQKVVDLCKRAQNPSSIIQLPTTAAVCVYPNMVGVARKSLGEASSIQIAAVATAFPSGQSSLEVKKLDTQLALDLGADEIDMVISRGKFLSGELNFVYDEIAAIKEVCGDKRLKVILETGELKTLENVRTASEIAMQAGADFIKTSTGKIQPAATLPVTLVMLRAIREHYARTGVMVGMKPAGGISKADLALSYLTLVKEELGDAWLNNQWFRYGASSLATDVVKQLEELKGGYNG